MFNHLRTLSGAPLTALRCLVFTLCLVPLAIMVWGFFHDGLGANPVETLTRETGDWSLRILLATLAITPLRRLSGYNWLIRLRRMLGLYSFFYASLHLTIYLWLDQFFDWSAILKDILKRPFITLGFAAFVLLLPLAITSHQALIRRLGGKRWQALHRSIYLIGALGVLHYLWLVKRDISEPLFYGVVLSLLLMIRVSYWLKKRLHA